MLAFVFDWCNYERRIKRRIGRRWGGWQSLRMAVIAIQHIPCEDKKVVVRRAVVVGFRGSPDDKFHDQYDVWHIIFVGAVYVASFTYHVSICHE